MYSGKVGDISRVVAPPYDVISPALQESLYERHPQNVVRLILAREGGGEGPADNRYTRATGDLEQWLQKGILVRDKEPALYLYEQEFQLGNKQVRQRRRGFIALRRLEPFGRSIRRHEETLPGPKQDRLKLIQQCKTNLSPVFSIYSDPAQSVPKLLGSAYAKAPLFDFEDSEKVHHRFWRLQDAKVCGEVCRELEKKKMLIADGHHRYEVGLLYRDEMQKRFPDSPGAPFHYIMMFFAEADDPGLVILPTHRLLRTGRKTEPESVLSELRGFFEVDSYREGQREQFLSALGRMGEERHSFGLLLSSDRRLHLLSIPKSGPLPDVVVAHEKLIQGVFGFKPGDEKDLGKISYIKDAEEVFRRVPEDSGQVGILLNPARPGEILSYVETGATLPPKSTYFYPKLLSGLVFHPIRPEEEISV